MWPSPSLAACPILSTTSNFLTSTATFMSPALSVAPSAGSTIFTLLSALSPQPATVADARTTTATTPAMNCPRGQRKFHTALLLIQAANHLFRSILRSAEFEPLCACQRGSLQSSITHHRLPHEGARENTWTC